MPQKYILSQSFIGGNIEMTYEKEAFLSDFVHTLALDYDVTPEEADIFQIHYTIAKLILGGH